MTTSTQSSTLQTLEQRHVQKCLMVSSLCVTPHQFQSSSLIENIDNIQEQDVEPSNDQDQRVSMDINALQVELVDHCLIVSPSTPKYFDEVPHYSFMLLRHDNDTKEELEGNGLWKTMKKLSLLDEKEKYKEPHHERRTGIEVIPIAAKYLASRLDTDTTVLSSSSSMDWNKHESQKEGGTTRRLWHTLSKGVYSKLQSMLAVYDLVDYPGQPQQEYIIEDDHNVDDARHSSQYYLEDDNYEGTYSDDAGLISSVDGNATHKPSTKNRHIIGKEEDVWSVTLLLRCCSILLQYVSNYMQTMDGLEEEQIVSISCEDKHTRKGIMVNRYGMGNLSFIALCHRIGLNLNTNTTSPSKGNDVDMGIGRILTSLQPSTMSTELIIHTCIASKRAITSNNDELLILLNSNSPNSTTPSMLTPNEVDVAIFKLTLARISLESHIESLSTKKNEWARKALECQRENKNDKQLSRIHLQKYKMTRDEQERCSSSLLNIETGLFGLQRARNDKEIVQAYETMNDAMKLVRGPSLVQVENVIEEMEQGKEYMERLHDAVVLQNSDVGNEMMKHEEELEKELELLDVEIHMKHETTEDDSMNKVENVVLSSPVDGEEHKKVMVQHTNKDTLMCLK